MHVWHLGGGNLEVADKNKILRVLDLTVGGSEILRKEY